MQFTNTLPEDTSILMLFEEQHPVQLRWDFKYKLSVFHGHHTRFIWLVVDEKIIGEIILEWYDDDTIEVSSYTILPEYRGKGFGKQLVIEGIRRAKSLGFKTFIGTARNGASINTFLSLGAKLGAVNYDWGGTGEDYQSFFIDLLASEPI